MKTVQNGSACLAYIQEYFNEAMQKYPATTAYNATDAQLYITRTFSQLLSRYSPVGASPSPILSQRESMPSLSYKTQRIPKKMSRNLPRPSA